PCEFLFSADRRTYVPPSSPPRPSSDLAPPAGPAPSPTTRSVHHDDHRVHRQRAPKHLWGPARTCLYLPGGLRHAARVHRSDARRDRKSTRLNSSHVKISYAVFCLKKKK